MEKLNFPNFKLLIKNKENKPFIFDSVRKKWLLCTPEEWVRVHCVQYLTQVKGYPASWILIEKEFKLYHTLKRFDITIAHPQKGNHILVECKAPSVSITQKTFDQIARYNLEIKSNFIMITNGLNHYFCSMDYQKGCYTFIKELPNYFLEQ
ncbi:MAG: type I restriction enzyme HsdR N-terminal domain-containing protein [Flavobacteriaceae bacterium]